jgi:hypothetical protein
MYAGQGANAAGASGIDPEHGTAEDPGAGSGAGARGGGDDVIDAEFRATDDKK